MCWLIYRVRAEQEDSDARARAAERCARVRVARAPPPARDRAVGGGDAGTGSIGGNARASGETDSRARPRGSAELSTISSTSLVCSREELRINCAVLCLQDPILAAVDAASPAIAQRQQCLEAVVVTTPPLWVNGDEGRLQRGLREPPVERVEVFAGGMPRSPSLYDRRGPPRSSPCATRVWASVRTCWSASSIHSCAKTAASPKGSASD